MACAVAHLPWKEKVRRKEGTEWKNRGGEKRRGQRKQGGKYEKEGGGEWKGKNGNEGKEGKKEREKRREERNENRKISEPFCATLWAMISCCKVVCWYSSPK